MKIENKSSDAGILCAFKIIVPHAIKIKVPPTHHNADNKKKVSKIGRFITTTNHTVCIITQLLIIPSLTFIRESNVSLTLCCSIWARYPSMSPAIGSVSIFRIRPSVCVSQSESCWSCCCWRSIRTSWSLKMEETERSCSSTLLKHKRPLWTCVCVRTWTGGPCWRPAGFPSGSWAASSVLGSHPPLPHSDGLQRSAGFPPVARYPRCSGELSTPSWRPEGKNTHQSQNTHRLHRRLTLQHEGEIYRDFTLPNWFRHHFLL